MGEETLQTTATNLLRLLSLDLDNIDIEWQGGMHLDYTFELNPEDFIGFAEEDLKSGDIHGLVNSLSNSKRAIDCQISKTLQCFGISTNKNFPKKMEMLQKMGIVAPRIVRKVTRARNYLEHDFKTPEQEQVEDAIDIAILFVLALNNVLTYFPDYVFHNSFKDGSVDRFEKSLAIEYDEKRKHFLLQGRSAVVKDERGGVIGESVVKPDDPIFCELIRLSLLVKRYDENQNTNLDIKQLLEALHSQDGK